MAFVGAGIAGQERTSIVNFTPGNKPKAKPFMSQGSREAMIWPEAIKHRRAIRALQRNYETRSKYLESKIAREKQATDPDVRDQYETSFRDLVVAREIFQFEVAKRETEFLVRQAQWLLIPVPEPPDQWDQHHTESTSGYFLTLEGRRDLRNRIREERRLRLEPVTIWLSLVIGVIGGLTGLISVLRD